MPEAAGMEAKLKPMLKIKTVRKHINWGLLLLIVSCSNLSNLCRHQFGKGSSFRYMASDSFSSIPDQEQQQFQNAAPGKLTWAMLGDVSYELRFSKELQLDINYPVFGRNALKLKGKEFYITGYMIPLNIKAGLYAISKNMYASCFFCGQAGVESVISLKFKTKPRRYKTDEYITIKGTMELNETNVNDFIYILRNTEEFNAP